MREDQAVPVPCFRRPATEPVSALSTGASDAGSLSERLAEEMVGTPVKKEGVEDLLWAMTMLPEFQLIY